MLLKRFFRFMRSFSYTEKNYEFSARYHLERKIREHANPLNRAGKFSFAQNEEDGITLEIISRLGIQKGTFIEFGVGDGTENNTLVLLMSGWTGRWVGGEELSINIQNSKRLEFVKTWITLENISELCSGMNTEINLVSLDLDGNDYHLCREILNTGLQPDVFIVEYNSKFLPNIEFIMEYNESHQWQSDDYYGASLKSYSILFSSFNYVLVCCNITGSNAFFVHKKHSNKFADVSNDVRELYNGAFHYSPKKKLHKTSVKTIEQLLGK